MATIKLRCLPALALLLVSVSSQAVEWNITPSIYAAETFTDNFGLRPSSCPFASPTQCANFRTKTSDFVTEIMPGLNIVGLGKRFQLEFDYRLQALIYARSDEADDQLSYASTSGSVNIAADSLFLDFRGSLNQQIIDPSARVGVSSVSSGGNRTEVAQFTVNPYFRRAIGNKGELRIAYSYGFVEYENPDLPVSDSIFAGRRLLIDSESNGLVVTLSGGLPSLPLSWRLDGVQNRIDYDTGENIELQRIGGELAWQFNSNATLFVGGGDENNTFSEQTPGTAKVDGSFWHAGFRGKLDRLTNYEISAGEQHFGDSYAFSLDRKAGLLTTRISYLEETTTLGRQQQNYEALFRFITDLQGAELPTRGVVSVYVRKRFSLDGTLQLSRSRLRLNAYNEDRDYLTVDPLLGPSDGIIGAALSWTWTAIPRSELSLNAGWQKFDLRTDLSRPDQTLNRPEDLRFQVRFERELQRGLFWNASAWRTVRSATTPSNEYAENGISFGIGKSF